MNFDIRKFNQVDICGLVKKMKSKERKLIDYSSEAKQFQHLIEQLPTNDQVYKLLSVGGGFSSISIIKYIAEKEKIDKLYVSTFRIGKKQFEELLSLYTKRLLSSVNIITSNTQKKTDSIMIYKCKKYNYYDYIIELCNKYNWNIKTYDNHSKLILIKTYANNYYVIETSSNLNENPKLEHFNLENDKDLYLWYEKLFIELMKGE